MVLAGEISFKNVESQFSTTLQEKIINRTVLRWLAGACSELEAKLTSSFFLTSPDFGQVLCFLFVTSYEK